MNEMPPGAQDARRSTYYLFLGFVLSWLPMPVCGLAVVPLVMSLFHAVRHVRALRRAEAPTAVRNASLVGVCLTTLLIGFVLAPVMQYVANLDYQRCMWGANTHQAVTACERDHHQDSGGILSFLTD